MCGKLPIIDAWREDYPHYIGAPTKLRFLFVFVAIVTITCFALSCVYYYEFDKETLSEITFFPKTDAEWKCKSIGTYNGGYVFANYSSIPTNLSQSTAIGLLGAVNDDSYYGPRTTELLLSYYDYNVSTYWQEPYILFWDEEEQNTFEITWGNAPTVTECIDMLTEHSCFMMNESLAIDDVHIYKFTFDYTITTNGTTSINSNDIQFKRPILFSINSNDSSIERTLDQYAFKSYYSDSWDTPDQWEYFLTATIGYIEDGTMYDNLCDIFDAGLRLDDLLWGVFVDNDQLLWAFNSDDGGFYKDNRSGMMNEYGGWVKDDRSSWRGVEAFHFSYECELISDDYCIVNASDQFTFGDPLPTNTRMQRAGQYGEAQYLLLSPESGTQNHDGMTCMSRWESVCNDYYDISGYCEKVYAPPYSCTKTENRSIWAIVSLSFASCQLVFTGLVILVSFGFRMLSNPVHEGQHDDKNMLEMQQTQAIATAQGD